MSNQAAQELQSFVRRIESVEDEINALNADKSEIYKEAKSQGYTPKTIRKVVAARRVDASEREEADAEFELYWNAIHGIETSFVRARVENIEEFPSQPFPKAGQAGTAHEPVATSSVENEGAEISTPIQSFADAEAHGAEANDHQSNAVAPVPATQDGSASAGGENVDAPEVPATHDIAPANDAGQRADAVGFGGAVGVGATLSFAEKIKKLRPLCQSPEACCSSGGKAHCNTCLKSAGQSLVSA